MGAITYAVSWQEPHRGPHSGRLELGVDALHLQGGNGDKGASRALAYADIGAFRPARSPGDRLRGRPTLVLELTDGTTLRIASVAQAGIVAELSDRLASLMGARRTAERAVVVVPLRKGSREEAERLIRGGPPFDPRDVGLARHEVYLTESEAVFVFDGDARAFGEHLSEPASFVRAMAAWRPLIDGHARYGDPVYSWSLAERSD